MRYINNVIQGTSKYNERIIIFILKKQDQISILA